MRQLPSIAEMDRAFRRRDAAYDGIFLVGVKTTGILCRPPCPARKPNPRTSSSWLRFRMRCRRVIDLASGADPLT
ncbi:MAG: hypothetical protein IIB61_01560 [Planctomycetes bacterium]|nr:hypothetical protein [Planctomycetota bacterium]